MKRIIDGVTYNTATSTPVGRCEGEAEEDHTRILTLYQTRGGAFFVHEHEEWGVRDKYGDWEERSKDSFIPMSREKAHKWFLEGETEVLSEGVFGSPPEAKDEEATTSATIYARVPEALKQSIEAKAKKAGQSINTWVMRCLERCASAPELKAVNE
jgi:predicted HicB family RNase H-like nuclease